jgi:hypothetical protein
LSNWLCGQQIVTTSAAWPDLRSHFQPPPSSTSRLKQLVFP